MTRMFRSLIAKGTAGWPRTALKVLIDVGIAVTAVALAYLSRFERVPSGTYGLQMLLFVPLLVGVRVGTHRLFGVHRMSWRLFGMREALQMAAAVSAVSVGLIGLRLMLPEVLPHLVLVPIGVLALEGLFTLTGTTGVRVIVRLLDEYAERELVRQDSGPPRKRAILVGAGRAGQLAARELRNRPDAGYEVVGFLDDDRDRRGQVIHGVTVLGDTSHAIEFAHLADLFILTMPSAPRAMIRTVVARCKEAGLPVRTVPGFYELLGDKVGITKIRPLRIEDLLGRPVVNIDDERWAKVRKILGGKRVLVTGAGGSIGSELCRQLTALNPATLVLVENNENNLFDIDNEVRAKIGARSVACLADIRDRAQLDRVFTQHRPEVVFHAAAFKHVPMMELHPHSAIENNVCGTQTVVRVADDHKVERFLFVSTDKAVNPSNVMGASKRVSEMVVQAQAAGSTTKFCCVRFGNVLGSRGSVLHTFQRQIENGGPVTVTHPDVTRFFMTIPEAVRLVIQASAAGEGGEVFLLDMGEPIKIVDMAHEMIRLAGLSTDDVPIEFIGLRPGEKLHEELLRDDEGTIPSKVEGVFVARLAEVDRASIDSWVSRLRAAAEQRDEATVRRLLAVVTGYRAQTDELADTDEEAQILAFTG